MTDKITVEPETKTSQFSKKIDYLVEDSVLANQAWVCMSFLSPEGIRNCKIRGIKVRGVYATKEDADARAKELQQVDPDFHVFVGEVGKWLGWDPDPNSVEDQQYREEELQKLMFNYKKNQEKTKLMEQERKNSMVNDAMKTEKRKRKNKNKKNKNKDNKDSNETNNVETYGGASADSKPPVKDDNTEEKKKLVEQKVEKLKELDKQVAEQENKIGTLDENLARIEELYANIKKKKENVTANLTK